MSNTELNEMLVILGRTPEMFYRDTPILLESLKNVEAIKKDLHSITHQKQNGEIK